MVAVQHRSRSIPRPMATVEVVAVPFAPRRLVPAPAVRPAVRPRPAAAPALRATRAPRAAGSGARSMVVSPSTYRRRQALAAGAVAALSAAASVVLGALGGGSLTAPERPLPVLAGQVYEVQPGDTFWALARSIDPGGDPRPLVDRMVADHGGPSLVAGEQIQLPTAG